MNHQWERLWETFHDARSRTSPSERDSYLQEIEQTDAELCRQVRELLQADEKSGETLNELIATELNHLDPPDVPVIDSIPPDEILAGRFRILRQIGKGGMGTVYEAFDQELGLTVALKTMRPDHSLDPAARERFYREINVARQITHPNACRIFDLFRHDDLLFLTMELLQGETLHETIRSKGRIPVFTAMNIVLQILEALTEIHRLGIVHRDLKSSNIILVPDGNLLRAIVTDFGLATTLPGRGSLQVTETGLVLGTPEFMAPEQLTKGAITPATDIYAFGLVVYEMFTGEIPLAGESALTIAAKRTSEDAPSPRTLLPDLDRKWERIILRCLERNPNDRFQSAAEVISAIKGDSLTTRIGIFPSRRRSQWIFATLIVLILFAGFFLIFKSNPMPSQPSRNVVAKRLWTGATGLPPGVVSTDGNILIDIDWQTADLVAIELASARKRKITHSGLYFFPQDFTPHPITTSLSPDSKQVAYGVRHEWDPGCELRVSGVRGSAPRTIYSSRESCIFPFDWSPDNQKVLALIRLPGGSAQIVFISVQDGVLRVLKSLPTTEVTKLSISPNGRQIAFDFPQQNGSANHDLFLVSLADGSETRIVNHPSNDSLLGWAADGKTILFSSDRSGTYDAWVMTLDGSQTDPKLLRKDIGQIYPLKLTGEGSLYYSHLLTSTDIYLATLNAAGTGVSIPPAKLLQGYAGSNGGPEFSPDGKSLIFQSSEDPLTTRRNVNEPQSLKLLSLISNEVTVFPFPADRVSGKCRWSQNGESILIQGSDNKLHSGVYRIDMRTGEWTNALPWPFGTFIRQYHWSSDGKSAYYMHNKGGQIWRKDFGGTVQPVKVYEGAADFDVSRDNRWLAVIKVDVHKGNTTIHIAPANGGPIRQILNLQAPEWISCLAWSPDSKYLFFAKGRRDRIDDPQRLWKISINGTEKYDLGMNTETVLDMRIHPDGKRIALWTVFDTSEIWVMENFLSR